MNKWYYQLATSVAIMFAATLIFIALVRIFALDALEINNNMVSFIGIIATFIVISNVAQVQEIKHEMDSRINALEKTAQKIDNHQVQTDIQNKKILHDALEHKESVQLAMKLLESPTSTFSVHTYDTPIKEGRSYKAMWRLNNGMLIFYEPDKDDYVISNIMIIEDTEYNHQYIETLVRYYIEKK